MFLLFSLLLVSSPLRGMCERSFTLVVDTTASMKDEIDIIKAHIRDVLNSAGNESDIVEYILVPFKDPGDVGPIRNLRTPTELHSSLTELDISGGEDCPENTVAAIEAALQRSKPESYIFVFTDAFAEDDSNSATVEKLCKEKRSQVVIFLSGKCVESSSTRRGNKDIYDNVAKACAGMFLHTDEIKPINLRHVFTYIKQLIKGGWNDIVNYGPYEYSNNMTFELSSWTQDALVAVSGDNPTVQLSNENQQAVEVMITTRNAKVLRVTNTGNTLYTLTVLGRSFSITLFKRNTFPFKIGFSLQEPRSLKETTKLPLPGYNQYIFIHVPDNDITLKELQVLDGNGKSTVLTFETKNDGYITRYFVEPYKPLKFVIKGFDQESWTKNIVHQRSSPRVGASTPSSEIIDGESLVVDYGTDVMLTCKSTGSNEYNIQWEDDTGLPLKSQNYLLEIPLVFISRVTVAKVTRNSTIYCKNRNGYESSAASIVLSYRRPNKFEAIEVPTDTTIEYGTIGRLECNVDTYPEAQTQWYHNDSLVTKEDSNLAIEEKAIIINKMDLKDIGRYECEVSNNVTSQRFPAEVTISGVEKPQVELESNEVTLKLREDAKIKCSVRGKPDPEISWTYRSKESVEFTDIPEGLSNFEGELSLPSVSEDYNGMYRCSARNILGSDYRDVTVIIQYAPVVNINDTDSELKVQQDEDVQLTCDVTASPEATVRWEMTRDGANIPLDEGHVTDDQHTHRFKASWNDSGEYHCIAENSVGQSEKTITVNVLVPPYIDNPSQVTLEVHSGSRVTMDCHVKYGNPAPNLRWQYIAPDSTNYIIKRANSSDTLVIEKVRQSDEGTYVCIAENILRSDNIKYFVKVK